MKFYTFSLLLSLFVVQFTQSKTTFKSDTPYNSTTFNNPDYTTVGKFYIRLGPSMLDSGDRHLLAISDINGRVLHSKVLHPEDSNLQGPFKNIPKRSYVTIASESDNRYEVSATTKQSLNIRTFQITSDTLLIKVNERKPTNSNYKEVKLQIKGVTNFHEQVNFAERYASKLKSGAGRDSHILNRSVSKKGLKLNISCSMEQDLYILLRCNKENYYRYVYFPKNKIPNEAILEWDNLGVDLEHTSIELPESGKWNTTLLGKNIESPSHAIIYSELLDHELGKVPIFQPYDGLFNGYHVFASQSTIYDNVFYKYTETSDDLPFIEPIDKGIFRAELDRISTHIVAINELDNNLTGELTFLLSYSNIEHLHSYFSELIASSCNVDGVKVVSSPNRYLLDIPTWTIYFQPTDSKFIFKAPNIQTLLKKHLQSNIPWGLNEYGVLTLSYSTNSNNQYSAILGLKGL